MDDSEGRKIPIFKYIETVGYNKKYKKTCNMMFIKCNIWNAYLFVRYV